MIDNTLTRKRKGLTLDKKIERALNTMPYEIIIQYSSQTDNISQLIGNATSEALEENKNLLEVFLTYALETYESGLLGHVNYYMQLEREEYNTWRKERNEIKKYIKKLEGYLESELIK